ncbi:MAG: hypothetical protein IK134_03630 [Oscillospiraceae bacterium]|nr:hypothetical protein [Oscillospiraceae bacterium]MBQ5337683.1 hypothetical protein [Oscillospiraceae bacterium]MBQ9906429.1 hypothetical protein [Oscillospiraceae bacterium]MBR5362398.1 hypothetical protein [Oscillospiraceae bacterium]
MKAITVIIGIIYVLALIFVSAAFIMKKNVYMACGGCCLLLASALTLAGKSKTK